MAEQFQEIEVERREDVGKKGRNALRKAGMIPAVVYGGGKEPVPISVDPKRIIQILRSPKGHNSILLFSLKGTSAKRHVMIKDFQIHPVSCHLTHADFRRIMLDEKVTVKVPIEFSGVAFGVKNEGGMVDVVIREIEVECLPADIPDKIAVDLTPLHLKEGVLIRDLKVGDNVSIAADDSGLTVVHIVSPRGAAETATAAEGEEEAVEPEVVGKGKKAAEGEEGAEEKGKEKGKEPSKEKGKK
jgi:large subunit ribosomal protein L25